MVDMLLPPLYLSKLNPGLKSAYKVIPYFIMIVKAIEMTCWGLRQQEKIHPRRTNPARVFSMNATTFSTHKKLLVFIRRHCRVPGPGAVAGAGHFLAVERPD